MKTRYKVIIAYLIIALVATLLIVNRNIQFKKEEERDLAKRFGTVELTREQIDNIIDYYLQKEGIY